MVRPTNLGASPPLSDIESIDAVYDGDDADWSTSTIGGTPDAWKQPVRVATTASVTISTALNAGDSIDGVTLAAGDRVLVKDQAAAEANGIYVAGTTPVRAADMDADDEVVGSFVYVLAGTANGGTLWRNTNANAPTLDTTALYFAQIGGTAGSGLLYFDDTVSGSYQTLATDPATATPEEIDTVAVTAADGEKLVEGYITASGVPGVGVIPSGIWEFHVYRKVDVVVGTSQLVFRVYKRAVDTTETELFAAVSPAIEDTAVNATAVVVSTAQPDFVVDPTDRLLVKVYGKTTSVASRTISFYHNGTTHYSHVASTLIFGGTSGPVALDDLSDVNASAPTAGDVLTWDDYAGEWVAAAPGTGALALDDLSDVNAPTPDDGDSLVWDDYAGEWVAAAVGTGALDLDDLGDVNAPTPGDGDVLTWDAGSSEWTAAAPSAPGGSSAYSLDDVTLHATYGDHFTGSSLAAKWTRRNLGDQLEQYAVSGGSWLRAFIDGSTVDKQWTQSLSPVPTDVEVFIGFTYHGLATNDDGIGPFIIDSTGAGFGAYFLGTVDTFRSTTLTAYVKATEVDAAITNRSVRAQQKRWIAVRRLALEHATLYVARFSDDGCTWTDNCGLVASSVTPDRIGWGRMQGTPRCEIGIDVFNVVASTLGTNRIRTPTSGTATYSASSEFSGSYAASMAADANATNQWAASGYSAGSTWWKCDWSVAQTISRVVARGRSADADAFGQGYIEFSDASRVALPPVRGGTAPNALVVVDFPSKSTSSVKLLSVLGGAGNAGFIEVEAYSTS